MLDNFSGNFDNPCCINRTFIYKSIRTWCCGIGEDHDAKDLVFLFKS